MLGTCDDQELWDSQQQTLEQIKREIDEAEAFLRELYEQKKGDILRDRLITLVTQP